MVKKMKNITEKQKKKWRVFEMGFKSGDHGTL